MSKSKRKFSDRYPRKPSNVGDPTPHGSSNVPGAISTWTEANHPEVAEVFKKESKER